MGSSEQFLFLLQLIWLSLFAISMGNLQKSVFGKTNLLEVCYNDLVLCSAELHFDSSFQGVGSSTAGEPSGLK